MKYKVQAMYDQDLTPLSVPKKCKFCGREMLIKNRCVWSGCIKRIVIQLLIKRIGR